MALRGILRGLGLLFYILLGFRMFEFALGVWDHGVQDWIGHYYCTDSGLEVSSSLFRDTMLPNIE